MSQFCVNGFLQIFLMDKKTKNALKCNFLHFVPPKISPDFFYPIIDAFYFCQFIWQKNHFQAYLYKKIKNRNENRIFFAYNCSFPCIFQIQDFQTSLKFQIFKSYSELSQAFKSKCHIPTNILTPFPAHILNHRMNSGQKDLFTH